MGLAVQPLHLLLVLAAAAACGQLANCVRFRQASPSLTNTTAAVTVAGISGGTASHYTKPYCSCAYPQPVPLTVGRSIGAKTDVGDKTPPNTTACTVLRVSLPGGICGAGIGICTRVRRTPSAWSTVCIHIHNAASC